MIHIEKINSFQDIALFEIPYITVKTRSRLQARSSSLYVARNYLTEGQKILKSYIPRFDESIESKFVEIPSRGAKFLTIQIR